VPSPAGPEVRFDACAAPPARLSLTPRDLPLRPALTSPGRLSTTKHTTTHFLDLSVHLDRAVCMHVCLHACAAPRAGRKRRITPARVRNGSWAMAMAKRSDVLRALRQYRRTGRAGGRKARDDETTTAARDHGEIIGLFDSVRAHVCMCCMQFGRRKGFFFFPPFPVVLPFLPGSETGYCCGGGGDPVPWANVRTSHGKRAQAHTHAHAQAQPLIHPLHSATRT
jgi:hypothetical protein